MAKTKRRARSEPAPQSTHLKAIPGGKKSAEATGGVEELLSGRVSRRPRAKRRGKRAVAPQDLPREIASLANVFVAGRTVEKEIAFKVDYAKHRIDEYCLRDFVRRYASTERRPPSLDYSSSHARFKFVLTSRTTLTPDKVDALEEMGIPIDQHTELSSIQLNYDAIRQHRLEEKLREALKSLGVSAGVLEEIFIQKVELKETFYDLLLHIVRGSLREGEKLDDKIFEVLQVLDPATQVRNVEAVGMNVSQCFDLLEKTEVEVEEEIA